MSLSKTSPDSSREKKFLSTNWNFCGFNFNDFGILVVGGEINIGSLWDWNLVAIKLIVEIRLPFIFIRDITLPITSSFTNNNQLNWEELIFSQLAVFSVPELGWLAVSNTSIRRLKLAMFDQNRSPNNQQTVPSHQLTVVKYV